MINNVVLVSGVEQSDSVIYISVMYIFRFFSIIDNFKILNIFKMLNQRPVKSQIRIYDLLEMLI